MVIFTSSMLPGGALGLLRKRAFPTTEFGCGGVVVLFRAKKAKRSPEPTTVVTSKATKAMYKVLRCLAGCAKMLVGVFVPGLMNESLPGLLSSKVLARVDLSFADAEYSEGVEPSGGGENWNEDSGKGAGVIATGREGCSGL